MIQVQCRCAVVHEMNRDLRAGIDKTAMGAVSRKGPGYTALWFRAAFFGGSQRGIDQLEEQGESHYSFDDALGAHECSGWVKGLKQKGVG